MYICRFLLRMNVVNLSTQSRCMRACVSVVSKRAAISSITIEIRMGWFAFSPTTAIATQVTIYILYTVYFESYTLRRDQCQIVQTYKEPRARNVCNRKQWDDVLWLEHARNNETLAILYMHNICAVRARVPYFYTQYIYRLGACRRYTTSLYTQFVSFDLLKLEND